MLSRIPFPLAKLEMLPTKIKLPPNDASGQFYVTSMFVVSHFFGMGWMERWVMGKKGEKGDFLRNDWSTSDRSETHKLRVLLLAEMLVNLQNAPGFWSVLRPMVGKGVEAGFAELEAGALLKKKGVRFAFRETSGQRGNDYDLDIDLDGLHVCGETKCKVEATAPTVKSFLNSIEDARSKNLPPDRPGAVFIKVPQVWLENQSFMEQLELDLRHYLETSGRLAIVLLTSSPEINNDNKTTVSLIVWKAFVNENSRHYDPRINRLNDAAFTGTGWIDLVDLWGPYMPAHDHANYSAARRDHVRMLEEGK